MTERDIGNFENEGNTQFLKQLLPAEYHDFTGRRWTVGPERIQSRLKLDVFFRPVTANFMGQELQLWKSEARILGEIKETENINKKGHGRTRPIY